MNKSLQSGVRALTFSPDKCPAGLAEKFSENAKFHECPAGLQILGICSIYVLKNNATFKDLFKLGSKHILHLYLILTT